MASSQGDRALTCKLPLRHNAPFLQFNSPDWSKLDIIGQTVLLAELTPRFGSFQQTCEALRLEPNEIESFLEAHFDHLTAREQGQLLLDQWVQDQAVPADGEDIPQQRPLFIHASSIEPACNFLQFLAFHEHVPAVRAWVGRYLVWPPKIDVSDFDMHRLNQLDISFPQTIQQAPRYSRYTSSLGDDARAVVALVGAWQPKADGTPDTRIAFIDVPSGTIAHGPSGPKQIMGSGRHYICWPTQSLKDNIYNDFVLSRNSTDSQEDGNNGANQAGPSDDGGYDAGDQLSTLLSLGDGHNGEASSTGHLLAHAETPMNPKGIMGFGMPDAHSIDSRRSFHSSNEPQGPPRMLPNPELEQSLKDWPGQIFQFRLPPRYTVLGPLGTILTFDPPQNERYDKEGNPHGVGGTYFIVPPHQTITRMLKHTELPANVPLRMKTTEPLVLVRNGLVLPRFVAPGVHEWSTREGHLDFYSATGCYDVLQADGSYDIIPEITMRSFEQEIPQAHQSEHEHNELGNGYDNDHVNEHNNEDGAGQDTGHSAQFEDVLNDEQDDEDEEVYENEDLYDEEGHLNLRAMMAAQNAPAIEGALQIFAPHREWLAQQEAEAEEKRLENEAAKEAARAARAAAKEAKRREQFEAKNAALARDRELLNRQREAEEQKRLEAEAKRRAQLDRRNERERIKRAQRREEKRRAQEQASMDAAASQVTFNAPVIQNRQVNMSQSFNNPDNEVQATSHALHSRLRPAQQPREQSEFVSSVTAIEPESDTDIIFVGSRTVPEQGGATGGRRRKREDSSDDEYVPTWQRDDSSGDEYMPTRPRAPRAPRAKNPMPAQRAPMPKPQATSTNTASGLNAPMLAFQVQHPLTLPAMWQAQNGMQGPGPTSTYGRQPSAAPTGPNPRRPAPVLRPIGPLLEAIRANPVSEGGSIGPVPQLSTAPAMNARWAPAGAVDGGGAAERKKMNDRAKQAKLDAIERKYPRDWTESDGDY